MKKPNYWLRISIFIKYVIRQSIKIVVLLILSALIGNLIIYLRKQPVKSQSREAKQVGILYEIPDNMPPLPKQGVPISNPLFYKMFKTSPEK